MRAMEPDSISSIVTDPPYGLKFMGKGWDNNVPGIEFWEEALRVAKPGCHLLAFGGTRTYHRLACAIEDAGWEIRDSLMWVYGCLSDDTEILVDGKWEPYHKAIAGGLALCYNLDNDSFEWQEIQELVVYDYEDTAYRIQSDSTDQIVSRNHRCIVERSGNQVFQRAETLKQQESVPVLEDLHSLLKALPLPNQGTGSAQSNMLKSLQGFGYRSKEQEGSQATERTLRYGRNNVRSMRQKGLQAESMAKAGKSPNVQQSMQRGFTRSGLGKTRTQRPQRLVAGIRTCFTRKDDGSQQSGVEGRRNHFQESRQLHWGKIHSMPSRIQGNGTQRRLCHGASLIRGASNRASVAAHRSCTPYQPQSSRQPLGKSSAICHEQRSQTVRASRFTRSHLATVTPIDYKGIVWCVRVPSGAFVARRNGHVFVTGNSGFPKSHNISVAIDKHFNAEREVIGQSQYANRGRRTDNKVYSQATPCANEVVTAPATDAAKQWNGWGTALKPAWEPICVARKPLAADTIAANVLEYGTGAINIDACRVEAEGASLARNNAPGDNGWKNSSGGKNAAALREEQGLPAQGRWPANVIIDGSDEVLAEFAKYGTSKSTSQPRHNSARPKSVAKGQEYAHITSGFSDTGSAARFFYSAKASQAERNADGENDHATVKPISLMEYLCKLVTPPNGVVLDPFTGSGSTGVAALRCKFRFIGIELIEAHYHIALRRLNEANRLVTGQPKVLTGKASDFDALPLFST